jgi:hypothetical protein
MWAAFPPRIYRAGDADYRDHVDELVKKVQSP